MSVFHQFHELLREAIVRELGWSSLRTVQEQAGEAILAGKNAIILAPTAGGKTEASFFPVLSQVLKNQQPGLQILYIAPIKALLNNQAQRLQHYTQMVGLSRYVWHGDTGQRKKFLKQPDTLLMTTPESLEVMLISQKIDHRSLFANLQFVIIDEIHALAGSDRGAHLRSVLQRVFSYSSHDVQRIGLSATVGNPDIILQWFTSDSSRTGEVVDPPQAKSNKQILIVHRDDDFDLADAVVKLATNSKSLLFCQSRSLSENICKKMSSYDIETYVHHSSISKEERSKAEELFQKEGAACIVCTSTLELGIDIGDLDKVFQAEAPTTVSSFLQRMGRTGRREGKTANTTFFCRSSEAILQAIALVELAKEHWVEDVTINTRSWPVLLHQILAICLQHNGITAEDLWKILCDIPDFSDISEAEFYRLLKFMLKEKSLELIDGRVLLGEKSEQQFGKFNFLNLYAVFSSPQTYNVETIDGHPVGQLAQDFVDQLSEDSCFILGGRSWAIELINHSERIIKTTPAPRGKQPSWGGMLPQFLSFAVCQKIKEILLSTQQIPYIKSKVGDILNEERAYAQEHLARSQLVIDDDKHRWYTYAGGRINATLKHALRVIGNWQTTSNNFFLEVKNANTTELQQAIEKISKISFWNESELWQEITRTLPQYRLSKFQNLMPEWAVREMLADHLLDLHGTWQYLMATKQTTIPRATTIKKRRVAKLPTSTTVSPSPQSQLQLPIAYIHSDDALQQICSQLVSSEVLGVDCETTIYPPQRMCMLQIATREHVYLIDPLEVKELSPLKPVLESSDTLLVIHNAPFERRFLAMHDIYIENIYDTLRISRNLRGKKDNNNQKIPHGLGYVCERELGLSMSKEQQASDWSQRPLTKEQLQYAALDAEVMLQLYDHFLSEQSQQPSLFDE